MIRNTKKQNKEIVEAVSKHLFERYSAKSIANENLELETPLGPLRVRIVESISRPWIAMRFENIQKAMILNCMNKYNGKYNLIYLPGMSVDECIDALDSHLRPVYE